MNKKPAIPTPERRHFIKQLAFMWAAAQMPLPFIGCEDSKASHFMGTGLAPYKVWEEMLMALRTSPDHLESRMAALIASKDPEAMFLFVRDEIALMPADQKALGYTGTQYKWGIQGVLRYGMATPREKAELLHSMYAEAGIPSRVVFERTDIGPEEALSFFLRPIKRSFEMDVSGKQWSNWKEALQAQGNVTFEIPILDPEFTKSDALADQIWAELTYNKDLNTFPFDLRWDNYRTPTVEFEQEGKTRYAHLYDPEIPFGNLKNDNGGQVAEAEAIVQNDEKISVEISCRDSVNPTTDISLVKGEWLATDLVGNQINFKFLHGLTLAQQLYVPIGSLRMFTPVLSFQSFSREQEFMEMQSFVGKTFTIDGKIIDTTEENPSINGIVVKKNPDKELIKKVSDLKVKAQCTAYPMVKLEIAPLDAKGDIVEGLSASDFSILDNEIPIQGLLESNRPTPRILILYDTSGSMPSAYAGDKMDTFISSLRNKILQTYPQALLTEWKTPSELFTFLLKASQTDNDVILYITDGDNNDAFLREKEGLYRSGPPAIILNVYDNDASSVMATFNKMAKITNGKVIQAKDQENALESISEYLATMEIPPYVLTYFTPDKESAHEVQVTIDKNRLRAKAAYEISNPDSGDVQPSCLIGLYCTITVGKKTIRRVLAGWDPITEPNKTTDKADFLEVRNTILGGGALYFEGEGPTMANALSDLLKYRLSTRPWGEAVLERDSKKATESFNKGGFSFHPEMLMLMAPLNNAITNETMTFASGIRIGLMKHKIGVGEATSSNYFDYLPTAQYRSLCLNREEEFRTTLNKTAQLALREDFLFPDNTLSQLKSAPLIERQKAIDEGWFNNEAIQNSYYWRERIYRGDEFYKVFDINAVHKAYWQIDRASGELLGMLPNGTGGGAKSIATQLKELEVAINLMMAVFSLTNAVNLPLSIVATYGLTLAKLYGIVCEVLIVMDATGMDEKIMAALQELACNVAKQFQFASLGAVGEIMGGLDTMIGMMGDGTGLYGCN